MSYSASLVASKTKRLVFQAHINYRTSFETDYVKVVLEADWCCVKEQFVTVFFPASSQPPKGPLKKP